ncbi:DUF5090 domain-containing protein [Hamiltosporidium tvaerminnensis]|uniref:DUF5090 domain-containing protein n=2 Tax=Hamiltosporidium TaxID=1176354 RepID=A0A4Q9M492_9MICR|nr:hypothetical protein LUQ84_001852 [Hamiltosporidium tvaerminnensis]TBU04852.1 DUF5090 domain-containing protein [Hamiltosporidium tvaerminnensis]TBU08735.1 DUF5090 domain-containing protein [Hamiltosporidium magnivora]TBU21037.1 DUF5090 domain-containing protein [Hamiltosporidium tvaerminnensis]
MSENKTDKYKETAAAKAAEAEQKVHGTVEKVEKSSYGKKIPTSFEKVKFINIIKANAWINFIATIPIYIFIVEDTNKASKFKYVTKFLKYLFLFGGLIPVVLDVIAVYLKMPFLFKFIILSKTIKAVLIILSMLVIAFGALYVRLLAYFYMMMVILLDFLFVYYIALLFKRIDSEEYDNEGEKIVRDQPKEENKTEQKTEV